MKTVSILPPPWNVYRLIYKTLCQSRWILMLSFAFTVPAISSPLSCPSFSICMEEPYFDETLHLFGIDVYISNFDAVICSGIRLVIEYSNDSDIIIDETETENSAYINVSEVGGVFSFSSGEISISGGTVPLYEGIGFTGNSNQYLFTIYFSAIARTCSDFTFTDTRMIVAHPESDTYDICTGDVGNNCEPEDVCLAGFTLGGLIESPILDCDEGSDGGIPYVVVEIQESGDIELFGCESETDTYGDYECDVVADLDYRVTPNLDYNRNCGLSSLDLDIYLDHILGNDCIDYVWQLLSGDVDLDGVLSSLDLYQIQAAILSSSVTWPSWRFVPTETYNGMTVPLTCNYVGHNDVPPYDPYIDVNDVDQDYSDLDFVGIKMGDANGTCTECSDGFTGGNEVKTRTQPLSVLLKRIEGNSYSLAFEEKVKGLRILFLSFKCDQEPKILYCPFLNTANFITSYQKGVFYLSYVSLNLDGESFDQDQSFMLLQGDFSTAQSTGNSAQNELISENLISRLNLKVEIPVNPLVYPNPTSDFIIVSKSFSNSKISREFYVCDMLGEEVFHQTIPGTEIKLSLKLPPNIYTYRIDSATNHESGKLIVQ